jgi:inhibitor of cysteine peptidase
MGQAVTVLGDADDGRRVELRVGDRLTLRLDENASTGYRWSFEGLDERLVGVREEGYVRQPDAVGSGGAAQWTLEARAAGTAQVKLRLWRRWEGDASVRKRYTVTLVIGAS